MENITNGSKKQIAWAEKIRAEFVSEKCDFFENTTEKMKVIIETATMAILAETSAIWWIDKRHTPKMHLIQDAAENLI